MRSGHKQVPAQAKGRPALQTEESASSMQHTGPSATKRQSLIQPRGHESCTNTTSDACQFRSDCDLDGGVPSPKATLALVSKAAVVFVLLLTDPKPKTLLPETRVGSVYFGCVRISALKTVCSCDKVTITTRTTSTLTSVVPLRDSKYSPSSHARKAVRVQGLYHSTVYNILSERQALWKQKSNRRLTPFSAVQSDANRQL